MIISMYLTLSSLILAGIANMIFTKTRLYKKYNKPIDFFKTFQDGKRIFGDNKTWIGFVSMIFFSIIFQVLIGIICNLANINEMNEFYAIYENTIIINVIIGALIGFAYMICELPNSFIKRRVDIIPGKTGSGLIGKVFFIIDQIDSLIGVVFVLHLFSGINLSKCIFYVVLGAITHIAINLVLFLLKIRRNL